MEPEEIVFLALQIATIIALVAVIISLRRIIEIKTFLVGRPGGKVASILVGVVFGLAVLESLALFNTVIARNTADFLPVVHFVTRTVQQVTLIITVLWAWRRISQLH